MELTVQLTPPRGLMAYPEVLRACLPDIANAVADEIRASATRELHASATDYLQGLQVIITPLSPNDLKGGEKTFCTIMLNGWLPNAVEQGWDGGDMKPALLNGRNAKTSERTGARYNVVPFRHGTPGTSGRHMAPMGSAEQKHGMSRAHAEQLGKRIHQAARGLRPGQRLPEGTGGASPLTSHTGYRHKTDIYAGMVRKEKTYERATQNSYMTFRMVSDNSDPASWVHPGIIRHDFFGKAAERIPQHAELAFKAALAGLHGAGA